MDGMDYEACEHNPQLDCFN